jgi:hypothetical protein
MAPAFVTFVFFVAIVFGCGYAALYEINLMSIFSPPASLEKTSEVDRELRAPFIPTLPYPLNPSEVPLAKQVVENLLF